ncbi:MAG: tRNA 2-thiouridine(34) synthase MnmA [Patescibacteria group bacterium]|jgi:tRNA-specific 2-thiouridylase
MKNKKPKVVVAMSGGVDSSVAAALLKSQGYEVLGIFMQFWFPSGEKYGENRCCSLKSWQEAMQVAKIIDIPIYKVNFGKQFKKMIVDEFLKEYKAGHTPNPCVACNKFIKFDLLLKYAKTVFDADYLATGHYIRLTSLRASPQGRSVAIPRDPHGRSITASLGMTMEISRPNDLNKDQTYFLYNLKQQQLKHLLFPLGDYKKDEIRKLAKKLKLPIHDKPDSQEVCFVGASHNDFLKKYLKPKIGKITDEQGTVLGKHDGLPLYTIGQRSGIGLSGGPWYVAKMDFKKNVLIVTKKQERSEIFNNELKCSKVNWIINQTTFPLKCQAQIRYHGQVANCLIEKKRAYFMVKFQEKQRAITPGQSIVFYSGKNLLGGGIIK